MPERRPLAYGECLQVLAAAQGFRDGGDVFSSAGNAALRNKRASPPDVAPGDEVEIPDPRQKSLGAAADRRHKFQVTIPKALLRIKVLDDAGQPIASKSFRLTLGDGPISGTTAGDGIIELPVPLDLVSGELRVYSGSNDTEGRWCWRVEIAGLDAPEITRGAWQRLTNLGYWSTGEPPPDDGDPNAAAPDDQSRDPLVLALRAFQHDEGLEESGTFDDATRQKLVEAHGI